MAKYLPLLPVVVTALLTTLVVHAGFTVWWAFEAYGKAKPPAFDWVGALAASGIATTVVLVAGVVIQRLAGGTVGNIAAREVEAQPTRPPSRPAIEPTVVVTGRSRPTSA